MTFDKKDRIDMGRDALSELFEEVLSEALLIGADNWDNYLAPNRRPELKESPAYQRFKKELDKLPIV